jgi:LmbE family N-acetylglucosaminyl deacetylase
MKLDFADERVLAVVAHPDDAELLCAGTLARAKADGAVIAICVLCNGDKGQPSKRIKNLKGVRRREMNEAAGILGAELFFGGFSDATLSDGSPERARLIEFYRQFKPSLVLAHSPEDYHTDHRAASALAEAVSWHGASRGQKSKMAPLDSPPAIWWMDTLNMSGFAPEFFVDVSHYANLKHEMLACHKSQLARGKDGDFSPLSDLMHIQYRARGMQADVFAAEAFRAHHAFKRTRAW